MSYLISPHPTLSLRRGLLIGEGADTCVDIYASREKMRALEVFPWYFKC